MCIERVFIAPAPTVVENRLTKDHKKKENKRLKKKSSMGIEPAVNLANSRSQREAARSLVDETPLECRLPGIIVVCS